MPRQRKKKERSERLRGERDQIKFIDLGFERWQVVRFRKARGRNLDPNGLQKGHYRRQQQPEMKSRSQRPHDKARKLYLVSAALEIEKAMQFVLRVAINRSVIPTICMA